MQSQKEGWMKEIWKNIINFGIKPMGSENLLKTSIYLEHTMEEICDEVKLCLYPVAAWEAEEWHLLDGDENEIDSYLFLESGSSNWFEGVVKFAGFHRVWDMYVWRRYMLVGDDGQIKAYITVREGEEAVPQMLFARGDLPHFMIGEKDEERLVNASRHKTKMKGYASTINVPNSFCRNVTGSIGQGDKKIIICAHYDTVYSTVGAYDNAAGTAVVLEIARRMSGYSINTKLEFILMDGEEFQLTGSKKQAGQEKEEIMFVLNIDGVGRENTLEIWSGPEQFERRVREILDDSRESFFPEYICPPPPGSDHAPYYEKGIDVCMLTFNDQGILHSPKDTYEESKLANMEKMVRIAIELLEGLNVIETK